MPTFKLLLAGDVMTGRGIDQVLPYPVNPSLVEPVVHDARDYIRLAESIHGSIPYPVALEYPWGDSLGVMDAMKADARIINLETAITSEPIPWAEKSIHYRMHPRNINCLKVAKIDVCCLANNHILDWGWNGLSETLRTLHMAGITGVGAGLSPHQAQRPAVVPFQNLNGESSPSAELKPSGQLKRLLIFAWTMASSGTPSNWAVDIDHPGVAFLSDLNRGTVRWLARFVLKHRRPGDRVVVSLHWGENWVSTVPQAHQWFARQLIDLADIDVIYGHSSHHPLPFEIYHNKLILYGCGDLLNDYEGIPPRAPWRSDIGCFYGVELDWQNGQLLSLEIVPWLIRGFQLRRTNHTDENWLERALSLNFLPDTWRWRRLPTGGLLVIPHRKAELIDRNDGA